jgi:hypothetical protein
LILFVCLLGWSVWSIVFVKPLVVIYQVNIIIIITIITTFITITTVIIIVVTIVGLSRKVGALSGLSPHQFEMFYWLQKSLDKSTPMKTMGEVLQYRRMSKHPMLWQVISMIASLDLELCFIS